MTARSLVRPAKLLDIVRRWGNAMRFGQWRGIAPPTSLAVAIFSFAAVTSASSADLDAPPPARSQYAMNWERAAPDLDRDIGETFEARFGTYSHGVGGAEAGTFDLHGAILTPRLNFFGVKGYWVGFIPRVDFGGSLNLCGKTSFAYTDLLWTVPINNYFFVEPFFGVAVHNGSLTGAPGKADLGCPELFHLGISLGVPIDKHWSALATFEHLSNGKQSLGTDCGTNQTGLGNGNSGLNNYGLQLGYAF
jgi:lipid A 3-O-deacylase